MAEDLGARLDRSSAWYSVCCLFETFFILDTPPFAGSDGDDGGGGCGVQYRPSASRWPGLAFLIHSLA